jgi:cytochrome d ubiquinol oxidase subunit I
MDALDLARLQFGATTVYHFLFVPLTIGLSPLVAIMQTIWFRTGDQMWFRITRFFGKLLLINFAIGVATGIVQEFQFGMNWSEYSRFVGDVFGAPLAIEGLAAFFIESTFLGLWIFGWDRLPRKIHLLCIWMVAIGTSLSAYFIIAANSFMQHPVAARYNPETGRAELQSIGELLTNPTTLVAFPHVLSGALMTAAGRGASLPGRDDDRTDRTDRLRHRRDGHRRRAGQDHVRAAADEDGRRRRALPGRHRGAVLHPVDRRPLRPEQLWQRAARHRTAGGHLLPGHR